jgi:hypothetical protein
MPVQKTVQIHVPGIAPVAVTQTVPHLVLVAVKLVVLVAVKLDVIAVVIQDATQRHKVAVEVVLLNVLQVALLLVLRPAPIPAETPVEGPAEVVVHILVPQHVIPHPVVAVDAVDVTEHVVPGVRQPALGPVPVDAVDAMEHVVPGVRQPALEPVPDVHPVHLPVREDVEPVVMQAV